MALDVPPPSPVESAAQVPTGDLSLRRVEPRQRALALSVLLTGHARAGGGAVEQFLLYAQENRLSLDDLWLAVQCEQPVAAVLIMPCVGRTALLFVSPLTHPRQAPPLTALLQAACRSLQRERVHLVQALLEPGQELARQAINQAGFSELARLVYLQRTARRQFEPLALGEGLSALTWRSDRRELFAGGILASYIDTLDCPALRGLRQIDDIIDGHMATGQFAPELWHVLHERGRPAGVMLLNLLPPPQKSMELVYLGLAPEYRRRGLARALLAHGLGLAPRYGADSMICALDEANAPAAVLYRKMGFIATARKTALILPLRHAPPPR